MFGFIDDTDKFEKKQWKDVVTIVNGKDYKSVVCEDDGYPVYGTGGIMARAKEYLCPEDSILMGRKGTIDKPLLITEKYWNVDTAFGIVPNRDILNAVYLYWYCKQIDYSKLNKATTLPSTTKVDLYNLWINLPPMDLQLKFASLVQQADKSKFDALRCSNLNLWGSSVISKAIPKA